jgi:hypothetical protein
MNDLGPTGRVVVFGGSIPGLSAVRELRRSGFSGPIRVVDTDADAPYRRPDSLVAIGGVGAAVMTRRPDVVNGLRARATARAAAV